jgi:hypothetical protein
VPGKRLILLAGLHKTATTTIQLTCARNRRALMEAGLFYPLGRGLDSSQNANHTTALLVLFGRPPYSGVRRFGSKLERDDVRAMVPQLRARFAERLEKVQTGMVLAAESVSTYTVEELEGMRGWFEARGWEVEVICHVRRLSAWISSMIDQHVTGQSRLSIDAAVAEFVRGGGVVRPRIENLRSVFPDAKFFSHETAVKHPQGPAGFFFDTIGVPLKQGAAVEANKGRSDCATRAISLLNEKFGMFDAHGEFNPRYRPGKNFLAKLKAIEGPRFALTRGDVEPLLPLLAAENEWLLQTLGPEFHDKDLAFSEAPACQWTEPRAAQLREAIAAMPEDAREWMTQKLAL